jgi:hypothetical protein
LDSGVPTDLQVGDVNVGYFGWQTRVAPVQAEEAIQSVVLWLNVRRASNRRMPVSSENFALLKNHDSPPELMLPVMQRF